MGTMDEAEIEDFLEGSFVKSFENRETIIYEFDMTHCRIVPKNDFNGNPPRFSDMLCEILSLWSRAGSSGIFREHMVKCITN
jgi:hypothetical protein